MTRSLSRRLVLGSASASILLGRFSRPAMALSNDDATALVEKAVAEINRIIDSGETQDQMLVDFGKVFDTYADVPVIARSTLGTAVRSLSANDVARYTTAFRNYLTRRYGRRFAEFVGARIETQRAVAASYGVEVQTTVYLVGQSPFRVDFRVSDKSGRVLFFDMLIEGVGILQTERTEVGALLDSYQGDIDKVIAHLNGL